MNSKEQKIVLFLLRFGVAFTFLFAAVSAFSNPGPWVKYFPAFIKNYVSTTVLLGTWGSAEILIGLWLLSGYKTFIPSILACIFLIGIFVFDYQSMPIIFRNVSILATALSLVIVSNPWKKSYAR